MARCTTRCKMLQFHAKTIMRDWGDVELARLKERRRRRRRKKNNLLVLRVPGVVLLRQFFAMRGVLLVMKTLEDERYVVRKAYKCIVSEIWSFFGFSIYCVYVVSLHSESTDFVIYMPVPWLSQTCSTISVKNIRRLMVSLVCTSYAECARLRTRASIQKSEETTASLASLLATPMEKVGRAWNSFDKHYILSSNIICARGWSLDYVKQVFCFIYLSQSMLYTLMHSPCRPYTCWPTQHSSHHWHHSSWNSNLGSCVAFAFSCDNSAG